MINSYYKLLIIALIIFTRKNFNQCIMYILFILDKCIINDETTAHDYESGLSFRVS